MGCGCGGGRGVRGVGRRPIVNRTKGLTRAIPRSVRALEKLERQKAEVVTNPRQLNVTQSSSKQRALLVDRKRRLSIAALSKK